ncbi:MAG: hypothetical protein HUU15_18805 [Candidatus Brocadiae bacterium]|nr:hypothetical protein [Candidatus Brocadiia bacterium]
MGFRSRIVVPMALVAMCAGAAKADVKKRWELEFSHERPEHFTYRSPMGTQKNFIYLVYSVTNKTPQICPVIFDVALQVDKRNYQQAGFWPIEEQAMIAEADRMTGYSEGVRKEIIEDLKKRKKYLNGRDLRSLGADKPGKLPTIAPGETIHCIAVFEDLAFRYNEVNVLVSGLADPVTYKSQHDPGKSTSDSNIHLRYVNSVYRISYTRTGDQFKSFQRGWTLSKKDWIEVGVNPAVTKDDIAGLVAALTNDDPLVRRVALDLLTRYTGAARKDIPWEDLFSDDPSRKVDALQAAKESLSALAQVDTWKQKSPALFAELGTELKRRIPEIPDAIKSLTKGGELNSDQIKELTDALKVVVTQAKENKCPLPSYVESALTRVEPTSEVVYDWICGYKDDSTGILYYGVQQWEAFIDDIVGNNQQGAFTFVESLFESLNEKTSDPYVRDIAIQILKDIATDERMTFDATAFDPKKPLMDQDAKVKDGILRWHEWWSRQRDVSYWNWTTKSFEPRPARK